MAKTTKYQAKTLDAQGKIFWTAAEHAVWAKLYRRQREIIKGRACAEFLSGVKALGLNAEQAPQLLSLNAQLMSATGWQVEPVKALISFSKFFNLLRQCKFPAATFIRRMEELDYLQEPDIFHEIFGHASMLMDSDFSRFTQRIGEIGAQLEEKKQKHLARLYWFTVEFGLIRSKQGLRIYGGGILSSYAETQYALESDIPKRLDFALDVVLRTPYRYDEMQRTYFIIESFADLYRILDEEDLEAAFAMVEVEGMLPNPHAKESTDYRSC
jgi:phenylalanine-4-hydroxylase